MSNTIYMAVQISSLSANKPDIKLTDIVPALLGLPVQPSTGSTQRMYCSTTIVHPSNSNDQYQIRMRIDGDSSSRYKLVIVGTHNTKDGASSVMDQAIVAFLAREALNVPVSKDYDDTGTAIKASGVTGPNGENIWCEVVWSQVQGG